MTKLNLFLLALLFVAACGKNVTRYEDIPDDEAENVFHSIRMDNETRQNNWDRFKEKLKTSQAAPEKRRAIGRAYHFATRTDSACNQAMVTYSARLQLVRTPAAEVSSWQGKMVVEIEQRQRISGTQAISNCFATSLFDALVPEL